MQHRWLMTLSLLLTTMASASGPAPSSSSIHTRGHAQSMHAQSMDLCRLQRATVQDGWRIRAYNVPADVSDIMLAAIEGNTPNVRAGLAALPSDQITRWRQTALDQAVLGNRPDTVRALIADGADPIGRAWSPPYAARFYRQGMAAMTKDPHMGDLAMAMDKHRVNLNQGTWLPQPLFQAAKCDETKVMAILFGAGASANATLRRTHDQLGVLTVSVINANPGATRMLLDHGADTCLFDHRVATSARRDHRKPVTLADIARKNGLPADLVARLQCHAP